MKPQYLFDQIINITECHEACPELFLFEGITVIELPAIPAGTKVMASFNMESGICQLDYNGYIDMDDAEDVDENNILGKFAMKLTLEPITE